MANSTTSGVGRYLTALQAGGAIVQDRMITLPRGASERMRADAEWVCERDGRYDYRHAEDIA